MIAQQIIDDAATILGVKIQGLDLQEEEYNQAVRILNQIFFALDKRRIRIGYATLTKKSDDTNLPDWAELYAVNQLAIYWAPFFQTTVSELVVAAAIAGLKTIEKDHTFNVIPRALHPSTPMGMNGYRSNRRRRRFYGRPYKDILFDDNTALLDEEGHVLEDEDHESLS